MSKSKIIISNSNIPGAGLGVFTIDTIKQGAHLGTYQGIAYDPQEYVDNVNDQIIPGLYGFDVYSGSEPKIVDASDPIKSNWTRYMNCARDFREENVYWKDENGEINFYATKNIKPNEELLFYYGEDYAIILGIQYISPLY